MLEALLEVRHFCCQPYLVTELSDTQVESKIDDTVGEVVIDNATVAIVAK